MSIVVTGASGHLGRIVVTELLNRGTPAESIVATARTPEKLADLAAQGVVVRRADYTDPQSLKDAFLGAERILLVSSSDFNDRVGQHRNVIDAALEAGVDLIAYTSILGADSSRSRIAEDHRATEKLILESGLPYVLLRNSWYLENYTEQAAVALEHHAILGSAGDGRVSAASRADYAAAAAVVLAGDGPVNLAYELAGDNSFSLTEYAATLAEIAGTEVAYVDQPADQYAAFLASVGVPAPMAEVLADSDLGLARGELFDDSLTLSTLIGRPTTPLAEAIRAAL